MFQTSQLLYLQVLGMYSEVKRVTDMELGIPSQCVVKAKAGVAANEVPRGRAQYTANVAMKINSKLDGVNVRLLGGSKWVPMGMSTI